MVSHAFRLRHGGSTFSSTFPFSFPGHFASSRLMLWQPAFCKIAMFAGDARTLANYVVCSVVMRCSNEAIRWITGVLAELTWAVRALRRTSREFSVPSFPLSALTLLVVQQSRNVSQSHPAKPCWVDSRISECCAQSRSSICCPSDADTSVTKAAGDSAQPPGIL